MKVMAVVVCLLLFFSSSKLVAASYPAPVGFVNDNGRFLLPSTSRVINRKIGEFERMTGCSILVVIVSSLDGESASQYTAGVIHSWGLRGGWQRGSGVLFLIEPYSTASIKVLWGRKERTLLTADLAKKISTNAITDMNYGNVADAVMNGVVAIERSSVARLPLYIYEEDRRRSNVWFLDLMKGLFSVVGVGAVLMVFFEIRDRIG